jgi:hypothetical protein
VVVPKKYQAGLSWNAREERPNEQLLSQRTPGSQGLKKQPHTEHAENAKEFIKMKLCGLDELSESL